MKYEYMLHTWGGFYNHEHQKKHGYAPGYFWFDTADARSAYISELRAVEDKLDAHHLAIDTEEGFHTRLKTIALNCGDEIELKELSIEFRSPKPPCTCPRGQNGKDLPCQCHP